MSEVGVIRRLTVKRRVRSAAVVEIEVSPDPVAGRADAVVGVQVDLLVFHAAPQPFDKDVVPPRALAVHADRDVVLRQHAIVNAGHVNCEP